MIHPDDQQFLDRFERGQWPVEDWHHKDHVRLAYLILSLEPDFDSAMRRIRGSIQRHNEAQGIEVTPTSGYHETVTRGWLTLVKLMLDEYGPRESAAAFIEERVELQNNKVLRLFYSRELMMSELARREWVEPDIASFPAVLEACVR